MAKPEVYSGSQGVEVKYIRAYEEMNALLSTKISRNPANLSVLEYYQTFEYLKKAHKPATKRRSKQ